MIRVSCLVSALAFAAAAAFAQGKPHAARALADLIDAAAGGANGAPVARKDAA